MPRDGSGVYTLPAGTKVTTGTVVESAKHNAFVTDVETDMNTARAVVAGGTGATTAGAARSNLGVSGDVVDKAADYTVAETDRGKLIRSTATLTLTLPPAATVGNGWKIDVLSQSGTLTIDGNAAETIDGSATIALSAGQSASLHSDGTNFASKSRTVIPDGSVTTTQLASKTGATTSVVTGTAGTSGNLPQWNASGDITDGPALLDEDDMASNSASGVPTQQSVAAYIEESIRRRAVFTGQDTGHPNYLVPDTTNRFYRYKQTATRELIRFTLTGGQQGDFGQLILQNLGPTASQRTTTDTWSLTEYGMFHAGVYYTFYRVDGRSPSTVEGAQRIGLTADNTADQFNNTNHLYHDYVGPGHGYLVSTSASLSMDGGANLLGDAVGTTTTGNALVCSQTFNVLLPKDYIGTYPGGTPGTETVVGTFSLTHSFDDYSIGGTDYYGGRIDQTWTPSAAGLSSQNSYGAMLPVMVGIDRVKREGQAADTLSEQLTYNGSTQSVTHLSGGNIQSFYAYSHHYPSNLIWVRRALGSPGTPDGFSKVTTSDMFATENWNVGGKYSKIYLNSRSGTTVEAWTNGQAYRHLHDYFPFIGSTT